MCLGELGAVDSSGFAGAESTIAAATADATQQLGRGTLRDDETLGESYRAAWEAVVSSEKEGLEPEEIGVRVAKLPSSSALRAEKIADIAFHACASCAWVMTTDEEDQVLFGVRSVRPEDGEEADRHYSEARARAHLAAQNAAQQAKPRDRHASAREAAKLVAGHVLTSTELREIANNSADEAAELVSA